jgi:hypothetical protein
VSGSTRWSEDELQRLELGVVGAFARGCPDAGVAQFCLLLREEAQLVARFCYVRVMGMKKDTMRNVGFARLAIFRPGRCRRRSYPVWGGWSGSLVLGSFGNIDQRILGRSIGAEIPLHSRELDEITREKRSNEKTRCAVQ